MIFIIVIYKYDELDYDVEVVIGEKDSLVTIQHTIDFIDKFEVPVCFVNDEHCMEKDESWRVVIDQIGERG